MLLVQHFYVCNFCAMVKTLSVTPHIIMIFMDKQTGKHVIKSQQQPDKKGYI